MTNWKTFKSDLHEKYSSFLVQENEDYIIMLKLNEEMPPRCKVTIKVSSSFSVSAFRYNNHVYIRDILGFSYKLTKCSQLISVTERIDNTSMKLENEVSSLINFIDDNFDYIPQGVKFCFELMKLEFCKAPGRRYSAFIFRIAVNLFLCSRSAYHSLRTYLALPKPETIRSRIGSFRNIGKPEELKETLRLVIPKCVGLQNHFIL